MYKPRTINQMSAKKQGQIFEFPLSPKLKTHKLVKDPFETLIAKGPCKLLPVSPSTTKLPCLQTVKILKPSNSAKMQNFVIKTPRNDSLFNCNKPSNQITSLAIKVPNSKLRRQEDIILSRQFNLKKKSCSLSEFLEISFGNS